MKRIAVAYNWASDSHSNDGQGFEARLIVKDPNDLEAIKAILADFVAEDLVDPELVYTGEAEPAAAEDVEIEALSVTILEGGYLVSGYCIDGLVYAGAGSSWEGDLQAAQVYQTREEAQARIDEQKKKNKQSGFDSIVGQLRLIEL